MAITPFFTSQLATSTPLNLNDGFALFSSGTVRAGLTSSSNDLPLLDNDNSIIGGFSLEGTFGGQLFIGLVGPAYALALTLGDGRVQFTQNNGQIVLQSQFTVPDDETQAGFLFGASLGLDFNFTIGEWLVKKFEIETIPINFSFSIDLLQLLITLLVQKLDNARLTSVANILPQLGSSWGMFDDQVDAFFAGGPALLQPTLEFPINLEPLLELIPEVGEGVAAVNKVLSKLGGGIGFGPFFAIGLEIGFDLAEFGAAGLAPAPLSYDGNNAVYSAILTQQNGSPLDQVTVTVRHRASRLDFGLGVYACLTLGDAFNLSASAGPFSLGSVNLDGEIHTNTLTGPYTQPQASRQYEVSFAC